MSYPQDVPLRPSVDVSGQLSAFKERNVGELDLIHRIRTRAGSAPPATIRLGIGDDCALLRLPPGEELAVTTDLSIAGRHFQLAWHPPESIGHRTLARGLSDLAAMGARPLAAFLSLGLPKELAQSPQARNAAPWLERYLDGFFALANASVTPLAGGDLAESPIPVADIVLLGAVRRGHALLRSGARPGHLLYVTGSLGGAAASLARLAAWANRKSTSNKKLPAPRLPKSLQLQLAPHLAPQPRLAQGQALASRRLASATIDISDGLSTDLAHICAESRVAAEIDAASLPINRSATIEHALHGGEDYELLFTAPPATRIPRSIAGVPITRIGRILRSKPNHPQITLRTAQGPQPLHPCGWQHFAESLLLHNSNDLSSKP